MNGTEDGPRYDARQQRWLTARLVVDAEWTARALARLTERHGGLTVELVTVHAVTREGTCPVVMHASTDGTPRGLARWVTVLGDVVFDHYTRPGQLTVRGCLYGRPVAVVFDQQHIAHIAHAVDEQRARGEQRRTP